MSTFPKSTFDVLESYVLLRRHVALLRSTEAGELDFGHNQISVLYRLSLSSATMGELAEHTASDKASISRTISLLEKAGLVKRVTDKLDRRISHIELTTKGKVYAQQAQEIRNSIGHKLDANLTPAERKQFVHLVEKITQSSGKKT